MSAEAGPLCPKFIPVEQSEITSISSSEGMCQLYCVLTIISAISKYGASFINTVNRFLNNAILLEVQAKMYC